MRGDQQDHHLVLLIAAEVGGRNRRTIAAVLLGAMTVFAGAAAAIAVSAPGQDEAVGQALVTILGWTEGLWRALVVALLVLALLVVVDVLVRRRWRLARDVLVALAVLAGAGSVLGQVVGPSWFAVDRDMWSRWGFPEYRLAAAAAVVAVVGPELVVPVRRLLGWLLALAAVALLAMAAALPSDVLAALALGLGSGALVRLLFGSAAGIPPSDLVRESMLSLAGRRPPAVDPPAARCGGVHRT